MQEQIPIEELKRLLDAASPGDWYAVENTCYCEIRVADGQIGDMCASTCYDPQGLDIKGNMALSRANAECAVAAHNAMPALLSLLESYRAAMRQIMADSHGGLIGAGVTDEVLLEFAESEITGMPALLARIEELEAELSQCRQAIGLLTTQTPEVEMNGLDPVAMAQEMVVYLESVVAERGQLAAQVARLRHLQSWLEGRA